MAEDWRIGIGYDVHPVVAGRPLILGGLHIPCGFGLMGHLDGDVVLHALMEALFGAVGLPDVIERFPEDLEQLARSLGVPVHKLHEFGVQLPSRQPDSPHRFGSQMMLAQALDEVRAEKWVINNVDLMILAKRPQLSPHKLSIRKSLAESLNLEWERLSVKANPNAGIDLVEQGRAIACHAALTLRRT